MPHFRLISSGRPHIQADEIIVARDEETGKDHSLSIHESRSIPDELVDEAKSVASRLGMRVVEADAPAEDDQEQPPGDDAASQGSATVSGRGGGTGSSGGSDSSATTAGTTAGGSGTPATGPSNS